MCLMGNTEFLCTQGRESGPLLLARAKSHIFSRVAVETWGTISSYSGDGYSKFVFVQQRPDSYVVTRENSGISTRLARAIGTIHEVRQETEGHFPASTVVFGFLSICKKRQVSSPFEALNSTRLSRCQKDVRPPVQMKR